MNVKSEPLNTNHSQHLQHLAVAPPLKFVIVALYSVGNLAYIFPSHYLRQLHQHAVSDWLVLGVHPFLQTQLMIFF